MLSRGITHSQFPIANFQFVLAANYLVLPMGNRQLEIGNATTPPLH
jgi:hypothetical protein